MYLLGMQIFPCLVTMMRRNYCQNLILKWIHMWWLFDVLNQLGAQKYFYHLLCSHIYSDVLNLAIILYPDFSFAWISIQIHVNFTWIQNVIHDRFFFREMQWRNSRNMSLSRWTFIHSVLIEENMNVLPCAICWSRFCKIYASTVSGNVRPCFLCILLQLAIVNKIY